MSQSKPPAPARPAYAVRQQLRQAHGLPFAELLPAELIHRPARRLGLAFRHRLFTPAVTLLTFLGQVLDRDHSCRSAVARLLACRCAAGLRPCSPDTGPYGKARARLPEGLLRELARDGGRRATAGPARLVTGPAPRIEKTAGRPRLASHSQ